MDQTEILELLIKNMKTQQENMDWLVNNINNGITKALDDTSVRGRLDKRDNIQMLLNHEEYCNAKSNAYQEIQEWAEAMLQEAAKKKEKNDVREIKDFNWFESKIDAYGREKGSHIAVISVKNLLKQMNHPNK